MQRILIHTKTNPFVKYGHTPGYAANLVVSIMLYFLIYRNYFPIDFFDMGEYLFNSMMLSCMVPALPARVSPVRCSVSTENSLARRRSCDVWKTADIIIKSSWPCRLLLRKLFQVSLTHLIGSRHASLR